MIRITVAGLLAAAWLTAQTGTEPQKPTDPGYLHPMPVPKASPAPVPPGTQPDPKTQNRAGTEKSHPAKKKKASPFGPGSATPKKGTESPKAKTETRP